MGAEATGSGQGDWFDDYAARVGELWAETARVNGELAERWRARSLADDDWSVDTVTADLIEAWEHLTPLAGSGIELWLELVQQASGRRTGQP